MSRRIAATNWYGMCNISFSSAVRCKKERKGKERKGKERKGKERTLIIHPPTSGKGSSIIQQAIHNRKATSGCTTY